MTNKTYTVYPVLSATGNTKTITATTLEEAVDAAWDAVESPSICHHCSREVELADIVGVVISDEHDEVYDDTPYGDLERAYKELQAKYDALVASCE